MTDTTIANAKKIDTAELIQILSAIAVCLSAIVGIFSAAFIFICGMKYMDGPQGANNEAPVMLALVVMAPSIACGLWMTLRPAEYFFGGFLSYAARYGTAFGVIAYLAFAAAIGNSMGSVNWGGELIQLQVWNQTTVFAAALLACFGAVNFFATRRVYCLSQSDPLN